MLYNIYISLVIELFLPFIVALCFFHCVGVGFYANIFHLMMLVLRFVYLYFVSRGVGVTFCNLSVFSYGNTFILN